MIGSQPVGFRCTNACFLAQGPPRPRPPAPNPPTPGSGVRGAGRNREEGSLGSSRGGAGGWGCHGVGGSGSHAGAGPWPCTAEMHGILHMADVSGQGRGTGCSGPLFGVLRVPSGTSVVRNWLPRRLQHGFRSFLRHVSTTAFPWGRRQRAQPSRVSPLG